MAFLVRQVLVEAQARPALTQDARERRLPRLDRLAPQIRAVELEQVEGVEEGVRLVAAAAQDVEPGEPAARRSTPPPRRSARTETLMWFTASTTWRQWRFACAEKPAVA